MKNNNEISERYNLLLLKYPLIIIPLGKKLPLKGVVGLIDWWLMGELTKIVKDEKFKCNYGELLLFFSNNLKINKNFLLFGLGNHNILEKSGLEILAEDLKKSLEQLKVKNFALLVSDDIEKTILSKFFKDFAIDIYV